MKPRPGLLRALAGALGAAALLAPSAGAGAPPDACPPPCLTAGAARVPLDIPAGTPLAGYGSPARRLLAPDVFDRYPHAFWFRPAEGALDPLAARALVLDAPGARVAWVAVDLLAVDRAFTRDVERRLTAAGAPPTTVLVSASHTHSGPGAFLDSALMGWLALDRFDARVRDALLQTVVAAVRRADAARRPARVGAATAAVPALTASRLRLPLDPELIVFRVETRAGAPVALVWNYAIHGTMLPARNLRFSGDVMGVASRTLERGLGVPALYVNGAVGDVSPARHGAGAAREVGETLAAAARAAWERATPTPDRALRVARRAVTLPAPWLQIRNCTAGWVPRFVKVPLGRAFPRDAELVAVALGDAAGVTMPGELQTALGRKIKRAGQGRFAHVLIAGTTNDYLGYFVTPEVWDRPAYVTCATLYGPGAGESLTETAIALLGELGGAAGWAPRAGGPRRMR